MTWSLTREIVTGVLLYLLEWSFINNISRTSRHGSFSIWTLVHKTFNVVFICDQVNWSTKRYWTDFNHSSQPIIILSRVCFHLRITSDTSDARNSNTVDTLAIVYNVSIATKELGLDFLRLIKDRASGNSWSLGTPPSVDVLYYTMLLMFTGFRISIQYPSGSLMKASPFILPATTAVHSHHFLSTSKCQGSVSVNGDSYLHYLERACVCIQAPIPDQALSYDCVWSDQLLRDQTDLDFNIGQCHVPDEISACWIPIRHSTLSDGDIKAWSVLRRYPMVDRGLNLTSSSWWWW